MTNKSKIFPASSLIFLQTIIFILSLTENYAYSNTDFDTLKFINCKRDEIKHLIRQKHIEGLTIAFFTSNKIIWKECFGKSTYNKPVNDSMLFGICSMSKNFTALAVLTAVQDGLLDLDTPIKTYIQDFKVNSCFEEFPEDKITLRMMLSNTAGFTHEAPVGNDILWKCSSKEAHWNSLKDTWLKFPVNTNWAYSAYGFDWAAKIIENVTGMRFEDYVKEKIFIPLKMKYSTLDDDEVLSNKNRTEGFVNPFVKKTHKKIPVIGAGAVYSNIDEMIKFVQFHLNQGKVNDHQIIEKKYLFEMYRVYRNFYGLGLWITRPDKNEKLKTFYFSHAGGGFGYASQMSWFPEYNLGCVILGNKMLLSDDYGKIAEKIITEFTLNNLDAFICKNNNLGFLPVFKEKEKNKSNPHFLYPVNEEFKKDSIFKSVIGKYEVILDKEEARWFAKIAMFFGLKPVKISVTKNQNQIIMEGALGKSELKEYIPGLYFTNDGEAFDIRGSVPTFRNIKLRKYSDNSFKK